MDNPEKKITGETMLYNMASAVSYNIRDIYIDEALGERVRSKLKVYVRISFPQKMTKPQIRSYASKRLKSSGFLRVSYNRLYNVLKLVLRDCKGSCGFSIYTTRDNKETGVLLECLLPDLEQVNKFKKSLEKCNL